MNETQIPILIVGGSLVGLTASVLLGGLGVDHLLVERHRGTAIHPRAASFHQRTMEAFRSVGLEAQVEAAAAREFVQNGAIVSVDSLGGRELACFYRSFNDGVEGLSPTRRLFITQIGLEPVLRARAIELGARHEYATEMAEFAADEAGVSVLLRPREGGAERRVRTQYLIAADGAHSPVRQKLGIEMVGRGSFAECVTIYFRADLRALIGRRNLSVVYVNRPDMLAFFRFSIAGDAGFLAVFSTFDGDGKRTAPGPEPSVDRCAELVRVALGVDANFWVEIDDVQPWSATAATAERFRQGRIFLAGDAAHLMPPTGGFGGNTGVADVHNLAWKLAMVLNGTAGPELLDSYEAERRPIAELTVEQAYIRYVARVDPSLPADDLAPPIDDAAIELGAVYRSRAVIPEEEDEGADPVEDPRHPTARPGARIPHIRLGRGSAALSTLDLARPDGFVLLAGSGGGAWAEAARRFAQSSASIAAALRLGGEGLADPGGEAEKVLGIGGEGALLLRPDGAIAWRRRGRADDPDAEIAAAIRRLASLGESAKAATAPTAASAGST